MKILSVAKGSVATDTLKREPIVFVEVDDATFDSFVDVLEIQQSFKANTGCRAIIVRTKTWELKADADLLAAQRRYGSTRTTQVRWVPWNPDVGFPTGNG